MTTLTEVPAAYAWKDNAEMIADVARLGYLNGHVCDVTYGYGKWWKVFQPLELTAHDLNPLKSPLGYGVDFRATGHFDRFFDAVVFDPPYKLNGTPTDKVDEPYGVDEVRTWQERHALIMEGITECARISNGFVLVKCQNQVCSGSTRFQADIFSEHASTVGLRKVDEFLKLSRSPVGRPQPKGRRQVHARNNYSTLLVFKRTGRRRKEILT